MQLNRKSQKLSPVAKMAENLLSVSSPLNLKYVQEKSNKPGHVIMCPLGKCGQRRRHRLLCLCTESLNTVKYMNV